MLIVFQKYFHTLFIIFFHTQRPARGKTIQAKTRGKSLDKSKSDDKGNGKNKRKQRKGKNARQQDKKGNTKHKPFYKDKSVKKKSRKKKK